MEVAYRRCCGIDVHKDFITACVLVNELGKQREVRKQKFRTCWSDLQKLESSSSKPSGSFPQSTDPDKGEKS
jgi:hypothetical protein